MKRRRIRERGSCRKPAVLYLYLDFISSTREVFDGQVCKTAGASFGEKVGKTRDWGRSRNGRPGRSRG
jgi:hypothetical protein